MTNKAPLINAGPPAQSYWWSWSPASWCATCQVDGSSYWILTEVIILCIYKRKTFLNCSLQLVRETGATNKVLHEYLCVFSIYSLFQVSSNEPKIFQVVFCDDLTDSSLLLILQYETSCRHIWWPASQHQNTTGWSVLVCPAGLVTEEMIVLMEPGRESHNWRHSRTFDC